MVGVLLGTSFVAASLLLVLARRARSVRTGVPAAIGLVVVSVFGALDVARGDEAGWREPAMAPLWRTPDGHVVGAVFETQRRPGLMRTSEDGAADPAFNRQLFETRSLLAVGQDGDRIVYVDAEGSQTYLRRVLSSGLPDPTFGAGGAVAIRSATKVVADSQHRVLVLIPADGVIRFTSEGERDTRWDSPDPPAATEQFELRDLALMPDDGILTVETDGQRLRLRRSRPNGRPDPAWGREGVTDIDAPAGSSGWFSRALSRPVAVFPDGSVSVAWTTRTGSSDARVSDPYRTQLARLSAGGTVQTERLGVTTCSEDRISLSAGPDGTTFMTGSLLGLATESSPYGRGFVARVGPDLALIPTFGTRGIAIVDDPKAFTVLSAVSDLTRGRVLAGLAAYNGVDRGAQPIPITHRSIAIPFVSQARPTQASEDPCAPQRTSATTAPAARQPTPTAGSDPVTTGPTTISIDGVQEAGAGRDVAARPVEDDRAEPDGPNVRLIVISAVIAATVAGAALSWRRRGKRPGG